MPDLVQSEFRKDMAGYRRAVAQVIKLCQALPPAEGLDRLRAFSAEPGDLLDWSERVENGCVVLVSAPSARLVAFRDELSALVKGRAA